MSSAIEQWMRGVEDKIAELDRRLRSGSSALPGTIAVWAGAVIPSGYLLCDGGTFSSVTYPALAAVVGDAYGTHSGTTYFLPDFRGRSPMGLGGAAGASEAGFNLVLGQKWGDTRLQGHTHTGNTGTESQDHYHTLGFGITEAAYAWTITGAGSAGYIIGTDRTTSWRSHAHTHAFTTDSTGAGGMGNVHPVLGVNFIIKT